MDHKSFFNIKLNVYIVLNTANVAHVCSICSYNIVSTQKTIKSTKYMIRISTNVQCNSIY